MAITLRPQIYDVTSVTSPYVYPIILLYLHIIIIVAYLWPSSVFFIMRFTIFTLLPEEMWSIALIVSVCLLVDFLVCLSAGMPQKPHVQTSRNFLCILVICGRGSVLIWQHCNTLCTSGFVDDVMLSHNGPNTGTCPKSRTMQIISQWLARWRC